MFRGASLLKLGMILMALALGVVICAVVVSVALRGEGGGAAEVGTKLLSEPPPGERPRYSFGAEGNAAEKSSSENEPLGYSSSGKGAQRVAAASEAEGSDPRSAISQQTGQRTPSGAPSMPESQSRGDQTNQGDRFLPAAEDADWPKPTQGEVRRANSPRHYELLPGAVMGLTIEAIGIYDAPVFDSDGPDALANGVAHVPGTSWPWSPTPQRNVYLAGHRMGYRGTWSRMLFYNLDELEEGDRVVLRDRSGRAYEYRVSEVFLAEPTDAWVMGQVRGRDMVSLQTCTPLYTFQKRIIVRADRV
jgi:sortase A